MRHKLKEIRLKRKYTQEALATALDISRTTYTNIETGKTNPSFKLSMNIKKVLQYSKDDIFINEEE